MKILSEYKELAGQVFDTIEACAAAERAIDKSRNEAKEQNAKVSARKKELATAVEVADKAVKDAYDAHSKAKEEVRQMLEATNKKMMDILAESEAKVTNAEVAKRDAILAYNKEFGPYQAVYSGDRAQRELDRVIKQFDNTFADIIRKFII